MLVHRIFAPIKRYAPKPIARFLRNTVTALYTPIVFSRITGHFTSSIHAKAYDRNKNPIPWYTYPMVHYLNGLDLREYKVLEFGGGQSTIWWASRCREVIALEDNQEWIDMIVPDLPDNSTMMHVNLTFDAIDEILQDQRFDIVIIDGLERKKAAQAALDRLADGGVIIFDNSDGYTGPNGEYPIIDLYEREGFTRIDFYGFAPGVVLPHCTSLFFKENSYVLASVNPPYSYTAL